MMSYLKNLYQCIATCQSKTGFPMGKIIMKNTSKLFSFLSFQKYYKTYRFSFFSSKSFFRFSKMDKKNVRFQIFQKSLGKKKNISTLTVKKIMVRVF